MRILIADKGIGLEIWEKIFSSLYADCGIDEVEIDCVETTEEVLTHAKAGTADWIFIILNNTICTWGESLRSLAHCPEAEILEFLKEVISLSKKPLICASGSDDPKYKTLSYRAEARYYFELKDAGDLVWNIVRAITLPEGFYVPGQSPEEANDRSTTDWYRFSAEAGDPVAQGIAGARIESGVGYTDDRTEARRLFKSSIEEINKRAEVNSFDGDFLETTDSVSLKEELVDWYKSMADANQTEACAILGALYYNGHLVSKNERLAERYLMAAAERENPIAQNLLGLLLVKSDDRDTEAGMKWLRKAAGQGFGLAYYNLWIFLSENLADPEPGEIDTQYLVNAAELGIASAQLTLGTCFRHGLGVEEDFDASLLWYTLAARNGQPEGLASVAISTFIGRGCPKDRARGYALICLAVECGDLRSAGLPDRMRIDMSDGEVEEGEQLLVQLKS
jgi:TPR repeat protein